MIVDPSTVRPSRPILTSLSEAGTIEGQVGMDTPIAGDLEDAA
ncbi:MAG: hypothetical protein ACR2M1_08965 [Gemmatimonadaceae bacterium]